MTLLWVNDVKYSHQHRNGKCICNYMAAKVCIFDFNVFYHFMEGKRNIFNVEFSCMYLFAKRIVRVSFLFTKVGRTSLTNDAMLFSLLCCDIFFKFSLLFNELNTESLEAKWLHSSERVRERERERGKRAHEIKLKSTTKCKIHHQNVYWRAVFCIKPRKTQTEIWKICIKKSRK